MKAKITKHECFNIEINGVTHYNFSITSKWNGLVEYKNKEGSVIATDGFQADMFAFLSLEKTGDQEINIITVSPNFSKDK